MLKRILIISLLVVICITSFTFAFDPNDYDPGEINSADKPVIADMTAKILKYVRYFGIILSLIILSIIGLKYIMASADEKASYKENMVPYFIGIMVLMGSTILPGIIYSAVKGG